MPKTRIKNRTADRKDVPSFSLILNGSNGEDLPLSHAYALGMPVKTVTHDQNTSQSILTVTEDKILICLNRNLKKVGKKRWIHPLSLLSTLLLALVTSEFDRLKWMSSDLLTAMFIVTSCIVAGWLVWEITQAGKLKEFPDVVDDIFEELRGKKEERSAGARLKVDAPPSPIHRFLRRVW